MRRLFFLLPLVCCLVNAQAFAETLSPPVIVSPWAKLCSNKEDDKQECLVARDVRTICGTIGSMVVLQREGETTAILRVSLPPGSARDKGVRIAIDQSHLIALPFKECTADNCTAEYSSDAEGLFVRLRSAQTITVQGFDGSNRQISAIFPLTGFADVYDGPPTPPQFRELFLEEEIEKFRRELELRRQTGEAEKKRYGC